MERDPSGLINGCPCASLTFLNKSHIVILEGRLSASIPIRWEVRESAFLFIITSYSSSSIGALPRFDLSSSAVILTAYRSFPTLIGT